MFDACMCLLPVLFMCMCLFVALAQVLREMCRKLFASNNVLTLVDDKLDMFESVFAPTIGVFGVDRFHCTFGSVLVIP